MYDENEMYDEEVARLERQIVKEEERTRECQREIARLRAIVRIYNRIEEAIKTPDYEKLFELWSSGYGLYPAEASIKCKSLGKKDSISFKGFCAGFAAAAKFLEE